MLTLSDEDIDVNEAIESDKLPSEIRHEPLSLPAGFMWDTLDINDPLIVSSFSICYINFVDKLMFMCNDITLVCATTLKG